MFLGQFFVIVNLIVPRILAQIDPNFEFLIFETSSIQIYKKNLRIRSSLDICVRSTLVPLPCCRRNGNWRARVVKAKIGFFLG